MGFKDTVTAENVSIFMNCNDFAEVHDIEYDKETCVITNLKEQERATTFKDHGQGIYYVTAIFHCPLASLGGVIPEKGTRIGISDDDFMRWYYVAQSGCDLDMIRLELEAMDE